MNTKRSLLLLVLASLFGVGCSSENDAYTRDVYNDDMAGEDFSQGQRGERLTQLASLANGAAAFDAGAPDVAAPRIDGIRFRRYTEQHEQAYSFEAPDGWRVEARVLRTSPTRYRTWDQITSPDEQIQIAGGLPERYMFMEPGQITQAMGLQEGSPAMDGAMYVARYQNALTFAQQNAQVITHGCGGLQITSRSERPDEAQRQEAKARREGDWVNSARVHAAEIAFTCQRSSGPAEGRIIASTIRIEKPGTGAVWFGGLRGYLAPPHRAEDAYRIMEHTVKTQQTNPQWKVRQRQAQRQASQQAHQQHMAQSQTSFNAHQQRMARNQASFNAHQQRMADQHAAVDARNQAWQTNQAAQDRAHDQFIGSIRDETRVWDTNTGQSYDVPTGSDGYYIDNSGSTIVGTPGYMDNPDPTTYDPMVEGYDYDGTP